MDKIRMLNKDARYYRALLYKNEYRQSVFSKDLQKVKSEYNIVAKNTKNIQYSVNNLFFIIYIQSIIQLCFIIYILKDYIIEVNYHDYTSALLHMWQGHWKQIRDIFEDFAKWQN